MRAVASPMPDPAPTMAAVLESSLKREAVFMGVLV